MTSALPETPHRTKARSRPARAGVRRAVLENLSMLLTAGVDPASALTATGQTLVGTDARRRLDRARATVNAGEPLWRALSDEGLLTTQQTWLVRVGEESGALSSHMDTVVAQERREEMFRSKLIAAMLYPVAVLVIALIVGLGVSWLILPRLSGVFGSLNIELPLLTRVLMDAGQFLSASGLWAVPLGCGIIMLCFIVLFIMPRTRWTGQAVLLATPGIGRLIREVELARFGYVLGSLLKVGVPLDQAIDALRGAGSFERYRTLYDVLFERMTAGRTFSQALGDARGSNALIPVTVRQVITTAEQSAKLPEAVDQIGTAYERRLDVTAKNLIATMEPALLFIVWLGVVMLAVAIITPIYSVLQGVNR